MSFENSRYVAEIEIPEGYISIDCETEIGDMNIIKFYLNQSSIDKTSYLLHYSSEFKQKLLNNIDIELLTKRDDIEILLNELFKEEFSENADIHITDVEYD